jgi:hypothetical protein
VWDAVGIAGHLSLIPSSMGHVESRVNLRGPPRKAKYSWVTDSEQVPRGKGEREPLEGSEREHETVI